MPSDGGLLSALEQRCGAVARLPRQAAAPDLVTGQRVAGAAVGQTCRR